MGGKLLIAALVAVVVSFVAAPAATAALPLTQSQPFRAVCEAQGGVFEAAIDSRSVYCSKEGAIYAAFTETQLAVQRAICERAYESFFGVQGQSPNTTITFCSTA